MKNQIGQNMMLISSVFRNVKSFSLMPVNDDCPYVEAMFDPSSGIIAVITKIRKHVKMNQFLKFREREREKKKI